MADPDFTFDCCGVIESWQANFDNVQPNTRTLYFQVWRPTTGSDFRLVGQNSVSVSADDEVTFSIATGNNDPSFTNLPGSTSITNAAAASTNLVTITVTDTDSYDVDTLDVTMTTNVRYSFDTTTKILTTASSFTNVGSTQDKLVFRVVDQCDNTASATFTVTITNDPPEIQNLPAAESLSEDVTAETLIFTITATDSANDVTCSLATGVSATLPFLVKQIPSSTGM
ncbi:hypothetical protein MAR_032356 [Mya arenaria]|uniref:Uncharacterized protein n=1 Tax=Mya arenaria TaxID=6604 RepID=A0ABY7F812_MYAAR|nr:hypothetical protein MAR_032356 [Mya arenaria]